MGINALILLNSPAKRRYRSSSVAADGASALTSAARFISDTAHVHVAFAVSVVAQNGARERIMTRVPACKLLTDVALVVVYWPVKAKVIARRFRAYRTFTE